MIKPTVGRVVLFVPAKDCWEFGYCIQKGKPHAATVTAVHGDRMVNLSVFDVNGKQFGRTSVTLRQPEDEAPQSLDYCEWMEYQVKVAEKEKQPT